MDKPIASLSFWGADMLELSMMNHGGRFKQRLQELLAQFELDNNVAVNVRFLEWRDAWADLVKVALYHDGPHVSEIGNTWLSEFVSMNALRPFVGQELTRLGAPRKYLSSAWHATKLAGQPDSDAMAWALPWLADLRLIHYRQDLFERAGVDTTAFQTPQALLRACQQLRAAGIDSPIVIPMRASRMTLQNAAAWVWGNGGHFISPTGKRAVFNSPEAKAGFCAYCELVRYISEDLRHLDEYQSDAAYWNGRAAMTISGPWLHFAPELPPEIAAQTRQALPPGTPFIGGSQLVIWQHTRAVERALTLVQFLSAPAAQAYLAQDAGLFPTRVDVLAQEPYTTDPFYQLAVNGLKQGRSFTTFGLWGLVESRLADTFAAIWADLLEHPEADIADIVDRRLDETANRLGLTLAYH